MKKTLLALLLTLGLCLPVGAAGWLPLAAPGAAPATITPNWTNKEALGFLGGGTSWNIGSTNAAGSCGTFTSGDLLIAVESVWTNGGGDPGTLSVPTGWTLLWTNLSTDFRTAAFYKVATGSESCSTGFASSWTATSVGRGWILADFTYTGTAPGSPIDSSSNQGVSTGGTSNMVAPSTSPTNSNDLLLGVFTESGAGNPYTKPSDMTSIVDTVSNGGGTSEIMVAYKTLSASGATGAETATLTGTFKNVVCGLAALNQ